MTISKRSILLLLSLTLWSCTKQAHTAPYINFSEIESGQLGEPTVDPYLPPTRVADQPIITPTPSPPKPLPTLRTEDIYYSVQWGDSIKSIALRYNLLPEVIIEANQISDPSLIYYGQQLLLPAPQISETGPGYKIIPDSE
ncbi:MAG: LysM peptidoglycan-binding domain-containing protein, partial [Anaerolineales bacterium]